jgi:low affinity Fe/Cu permease
MVFIIDNTQNWDFRALQLKFDALLQASDDIHPGLVSLHNLSEDDLERLEQAFQRSAGRHSVEEVVRFVESPSDSEDKAKRIRRET